MHTYGKKLYTEGTTNLPSKITKNAVGKPSTKLRNVNTLVGTKGTSSKLASNVTRKFV